MSSVSKKRLQKNTYFLYLATVVKILGPLITLPFLTRVLSVECYGYVAYVKAYATYAQLLIDFGFLLSATKEIAFAIDKPGRVGAIVGDTLIEKLLLALLGIAITVVMILVNPILGELPLVTFLYFLSCAATILILDFLFRGIQKMEYAAIPLCISKILVVILTLVLIRGDEDLLLLPIIELMGNLGAGVCSLYFARVMKIKVSISGPKVWLSDLKESCIYFISNFATTIFGALTTLIVGMVMGKTEVAYWSVCMLVVSAAKSMYAPLANSLYPYMVTNKDIKLVNKIACLAAIPLGIAGLVVLFCGNSIMGIIGGKEYEAAGRTLMQLIPVLVFSFYSMLYGWPVLGALNLSKEVAATTVVAAVLQLIMIGYFCSSGELSLLTTSICCGVAEGVLLLTRLVILLKEKRNGALSQ